MSHTKGHMARAVMEGVAYHLRWISEAMERVGFTIDEYNGIGGGCNSHTWVQIISNVTGRQLRVVKNHLEAGASGAALAVAVGLGIHPSVDDIDDLIEISRVVEPEGSNRQRYEDLYQEYRQLYNALSPIYRRLYQAK
jgi:xylulokinase